MPSKQTNQDVIAIEELVNEIKFNLRLKAAPPTTVVAASLDKQQQHQNNSLIPPQLFQAALQPSQDQLFMKSNQSLHSHPQQQQNIIKKQRSRPSPYHIPSRSWSEPALNHPNSVFAHKQKLLAKQSKNDENNIEDPYELLQTLLKSNNLVKEAVRRLQLNTASTYSRKQRYFYDSDEETNRSPSIVMMCQLES